MKTARAMTLSSLVPLLGVAVVAVELGYRSVSDIGEYVLMWAIFLYPLALVLVFAALALSHAQGPCALWQFVLGGLVVGTVLTGAWFEPWALDAPLQGIAIMCAGGGGVGAATAITAWYFGVHERTA